MGPIELTVLAFNPGFVSVKRLGRSTRGRPKTTKRKTTEKERNMYGWMEELEINLGSGAKNTVLG